VQLVTSSGEIISLLGEIKPKIRDIARSLSRINRYTGHSAAYTVAQHSVLVSELCPPALAFQGLMHDAHESIIGDVSSPLKQLMEHLRPGFWSEIESKYAGIIRKFYGLPEAMSLEVKAADRRAICCEIPYVFDGWALKAWKSLGYTPDYSHPIKPLNEEQSYLLFMTRYKQLSQGVGL
jgi:hypothetical protein